MSRIFVKMSRKNSEVLNVSKYETIRWNDKNDISSNKPT